MVLPLLLLCPLLLLSLLLLLLLSLLLLVACPLMLLVPVILRLLWMPLQKPVVLSTLTLIRPIVPIGLVLLRRMLLMDRFLRLLPKIGMPRVPRSVG